MFATSTKTATFLPNCDSLELVVDAPAGAYSLLGEADDQMRREVVPTAATVRWMRGPDGVKPRAAQRPRDAWSSGRSASTRVQPLLLADRITSSRRDSATRSASWSGSTTRRSMVPTKPPALTDGR